jgi:hypothetical protein
MSLDGFLPASWAWLLFGKPRKTRTAAITGNRAAAAHAVPCLMLILLAVCDPSLVLKALVRRGQLPASEDSRV